MAEEKEILKDVYRLIDMAKKNEKLSKKYIQLAKKIAMRHNIKIPGKLKKTYCNRCFSLFNAKNSLTRIKKGFKTIKCLECNSYKRIKIK